MKKVVSVVCACVLLLGVFAAAVSAETAQTVTYAVSSETANPGDTVMVSVSVSEDHYTVNARLQIVYDPAVLEPVAVSDDIDDPYIDDVNTDIINGDTMWASNLAAEGDFRFVYVSSADVGAATGGTLFTLTFRVLAEAATQTAVTVNVIEVRANDGTTEDGSDYIPTVATQAGGVTVEEKAIQKGDITMDGEVALADALQAFYYVNAKIELTAEQKAYADVADPTDEVTINDALKLFYYVNNKISAL